jgi:hypothetical protein
MTKPRPRLLLLPPASALLTATGAIAANPETVERKQRLEAPPALQHYPLKLPSPEIFGVSLDAFRGGFALGACKML